MSQLINPVVRFDFHMLSRRGGELPPGAVEFTSFSRVTSLYGRDEQVCSEPVSDSGQSSVDSEVMAARQCGGYARFPEIRIASRDSIRTCANRQTANS
jgi:hypothetical protein